ncbi:MAG: hypothetical protein JJU28_02820 [Cyclobacteriaceae bacterium]|nr:hypothetical protein [Cyclobacteriaceae bacterium]
MKINSAKIEKIIADLELIMEACQENEKRYKYQIDRVHDDYKQSAINLVHYLALRSFDLREIQKRLGNLGMSRLAKAESHVMASLIAIRHALLALIGKNSKNRPIPHISIKRGQKIIRKRNKELFGYKTKQRSVRIMVTQPSEAASDFDLVYHAMLAGMNTVRINCAHDEPDNWLGMITHTRKAIEKIGRQCKITMDLGGPKIRTGAIETEPGIIHLRPQKNRKGVITGAVEFWFIADIPENRPFPSKHIPVPEVWMKRLAPDTVVWFTDTRKKKRHAYIHHIEEGRVCAICPNSAYIEQGTLFRIEGDKKTEMIPVGELSPVEKSIILYNDDELLVHKDDWPGAPAKRDETGKLLQIAHIPCTSEEIFTSVNPGDLVFFDDGKIEAIVLKADSASFTVKIIQSGENGSRLRSDKGINFPRAGMGISGLTPKDREDLEFIARYADVVNMSFVNGRQDVEDLIEALRKLKVDNKLGVIFKIETQNAFKNLPEILLTAMQVKPIGVMIARGDLAIECGWRHIGRIQEEILWMCAAAHIPTIWATQVLEKLAKKGIPSRAEITDAVMAQRADCVMLNKGPFIINAIKMLDAILKNMQEYQEKKAPLLPPLETNAIST